MDYLFRGKTKNGEWVEGDLLKMGRTTFIYIDKLEGTFLSKFKKVLPESVGMWTGLTDKNGKKIFEGDIVRFKTFSYPKGKLEQVCITNGLLTPFYDPQYTEDEQGDWFDNEYGFEIIGNIHDNPELIKETK